MYNSTIAENTAFGGGGGSGGFGGFLGFADSFVALGGPPGPGGYGGAYRGFYYTQGPSGVSGSPGTPGINGVSGSGGFGGFGGAGYGGGMYIGGGSVTLYNATIAYNSQGVYQTGGVLNAYNTLDADNGYYASGTGSSQYGPTGADYYNASSGTGTGTAYNSIIGSPPVGAITDGGNSFVSPTVLGPLQYNGGIIPAARPQTIALLAGIAIGGGLNPAQDGTFLFTDERGYVPTGAWDVGAYQTTGIAAAAPTATLVAANVSPQQYGQTSYEFTVTYYGAAGIDAATVPGAVVTVTPPAGVGGGPITASVVTQVNNGPSDPFGDYASVTVTYMITPPGGSWLSADNGVYTVSLGGSPITDSVGNQVAQGPLGTFLVETGDIGITKFTLVENKKTHLWTGTIKLTNNGDAAFSGPIFVLFNLPAGVVLENATGTYDGMPYLEVPTSGLAVGGSVTWAVTFNTNVNPGQLLDDVLSRLPGVLIGPVETRSADRAAGSSPRLDRRTHAHADSEFVKESDQRSHITPAEKVVTSDGLNCPRTQKSDSPQSTPSTQRKRRADKRHSPRSQQRTPRQSEDKGPDSSDMRPRSDRGHAGVLPPILAISGLHGFRTIRPPLPFSSPLRALRALR